MQEGRCQGFASEEGVSDSLSNSRHNRTLTNVSSNRYVLTAPLTARQKELTDAAVKYVKSVPNCLHPVAPANRPSRL